MNSLALNQAIDAGWQIFNEMAELGRIRFEDANKINIQFYVPADASEKVLRRVVDSLDTLRRRMIFNQSAPTSDPDRI